MNLIFARACEFRHLQHGANEGRGPNWTVRLAPSLYAAHESIETRDFSGRTDRHRAFFQHAPRRSKESSSNQAISLLLEPLLGERSLLALSATNGEEDIEFFDSPLP